MTRILIVPGLDNSGPEHWQTRWEALDGRCVRVEQASFSEPDLNAWCEGLERAVAAEPTPAVLVAHSLGCILVAHWAERTQRREVVGALLVAPADVESPAHTPEVTRGFAPVPRAPLPFPSVLVASTDDSFCSFARAREFAQAWGARFVDAGAQGHLNADSRLDTWPEGRAWLQTLLQKAPFTLDRRLASDTLPLAESPLSLLRLMNDRRYPWLLLVPKRAGVSEWHELEAADRAALCEESCRVARALEELFAADKLNVAALGNVVRQLHVHHVVRRLGDPAWPGPVWGHSPAAPYAREEYESIARRLAASTLNQTFQFDLSLFA